MITSKRYKELDEVLRNHEWRYAWCDAKDGCACSGCVNVGLRNEWLKRGVELPTQEEHYEYGFRIAVSELSESVALLSQLTDYTQQKKIPTLQEYRDKLSLISTVKEWMKRKSWL